MCYPSLGSISSYPGKHTGPPIFTSRWASLVSGTFDRLASPHIVLFRGPRQLLQPQFPHRCGHSRSTKRGPGSSHLGTGSLVKQCISIVHQNSNRVISFAFQAARKSSFTCAVAPGHRVRFFVPHAPTPLRPARACGGGSTGTFALTLRSLSRLSLLSAVLHCRVHGSVLPSTGPLVTWPTGYRLSFIQIPFL